jgi:alanyl-tRNA synthetase
MAQGLKYEGAANSFHGYEHLVCETSTVTAVYVDGVQVAEAQAGDDAVIVLDHTPFYAESGGQAGDAGELRNATTRVVVDDTTKVLADVSGHHGHIVEGSVKVGDVFTARVDAERRAKTVRNHSATHLMHKALREVLGSHVQQKGSLVNAERTRFDFAHNAPVTDDEIRQIEAKVNAEILANAAAQARVIQRVVDEIVRNAGAQRLACLLHPIGVPGRRWPTHQCLCFHSSLSLSLSFSFCVCDNECHGSLSDFQYLAFPWWHQRGRVIGIQILVREGAEKST